MKRQRFASFAQCTTVAVGTSAGCCGLRRRGALSLLLGAALLSGFMALFSSAASAAQVYPKIGEIAGTGSGPFSQLKSESVAVNDKNGHILVADSGTGLVYDFESATDSSPEVWSGESTPAGSFGAANVAVAVDNESGDVYVADSTHAVIDKFTAAGVLIATFGDTTPTPNGQLAGLATPAGPFAPATQGTFGIAVDQATRKLYATDAGHEVIDVFAPSGAYLEQITAAPGGLYGCGGAYTDGIAVNDKSGELLVSDSCDLHTYRLGVAGSPLGEIDGSETPGGSFGTGYTSLAASNSSGRIYINDTGHEVVDVYSPDGTYAGSQITATPGGSFGGVAVGQASGDVYVSDNGTHAVGIYGPELVAIPDTMTGQASPIGATSATLNGTVNPEGEALTECSFEYGSTAVYGQTGLCEPNAAAIGTGTEPLPVHADLISLSPNTTYHFRLIAANANGSTKGLDQTFTTFGPPTIDSTSASQVTATSARLETELNPHGLPTNYHFEFDTVPYAEGEAPHGAPTALASAGSAASDVLRSALIQGLQPGTTYHYRVAVENELGTIAGPDHSFTTQGPGSSLLPDGRAWEMVSPPDKNGYPLEGISHSGGVIQAAADGSGLTYFARGPIDSEPPANRSLANTQLLAHRGTSGWSTQDIATPHPAPVGLHALSEYRLFSTDLAEAAVEPDGAAPLSPATTERTPYLRQPDGTYRPLVNPGNVPPGTKFGGIEEQPEQFGSGGVQFQTATPDLSHVLLSSPLVLTSPSFNTGGQNLYEWAAGALALVSQIPAGSEPVCGGAAPPCVPTGAAIGVEGRLMRHAISADGARVFFEIGGHLYMRDLTRGETVQIDVNVHGPEGGEQAFFEDASADGSKVFFTDPGRLTVNSSAGGRDFYMCEAVVKAGHLACELKDLSVSSPTQEADVQGNVVGMSSDGSLAYFVANGQLAAGAVAGTCHGAAADATSTCNLYSVDTNTGAIKLVTALSGADANDWAGPFPSDLGLLTARVSPNGRYLAFMSQRSLTGYDNRDARSGRLDQEVYIYDSATGDLRCASCNPTGARPVGVIDDESGTAPYLLVDRPALWQGQTLAASIPGWTLRSDFHALYQSRYLSNSGRLFFNAADSLVPQDANATEDVYQYEPSGVGSCTTSSSRFSPVSGGCVDLISSGASGEESAFLDASDSGNDVFFLTASKLASQDVDTAFDVYDAHVCSGESPCPAPSAPPPPACEGDACQPPAVPPGFETPGSSLVNGPGNLLHCPKGKVKRSGRCVKHRAKRHKKNAHGKKSHRAAGHNRGGHK